MNVEVFINKVRCGFDHDNLTPQEIRAAVGSVDDFEVWQIIYNSDPESEILFDEIQITSAVAVKNGDRFRLQARSTC